MISALLMSLAVQATDCKALKKDLYRKRQQELSKFMEECNKTSEEKTCISGAMKLSRELRERDAKTLKEKGCK